MKRLSDTTLGVSLMPPMCSSIQVQESTPPLVLIAVPAAKLDHDDLKKTHPNLGRDCMHHVLVL